MSEKPADYHPEEIDRFDRFAELAGLEVADPVERINALKSTTPEKFMELLTITNGLVRGEEGFTRWTGKAALSKVGNKSGIIDLHPPDNAHEAFTTFFNQLKESIEKPEDIERAAVEVYFGIIGAHLFADGNGRTARAAYELIKFGEVPDEQSVIIEKQKNTINAVERLNFETIINLFTKEGYEQGIDYENIIDLAVDETKDDKFFTLPGLVSQLKYIAARRVMERAGVWEERGANNMGIKKWPPNRLVEFKDEYAGVRSEWFDEFTRTAGEHYMYLADLLEEGVVRSVEQDEEVESVI